MGLGALKELNELLSEYFRVLACAVIALRPFESEMSFDGRLTQKTLLPSGAFVKSGFHHTEGPDQLPRTMEYTDLRSLLGDSNIQCRKGLKSIKRLTRTLKAAACHKAHSWLVFFGNVWPGSPSFQVHT